MICLMIFLNHNFMWINHLSAFKTADWEEIHVMITARVIREIFV